MNARSLRSRRVLRWAALPVAIAASGFLVSQASYAAFSANTNNAANNWTSGTVALADDDSGAAMFNATNLKPGSQGSKCITVTSSGTLPSVVRLYGAGSATTKALNTYLDVTITAGNGGSFGSCTGFTPLGSGANVFTGTLAAFAAQASDYATGLGNWATTGGANETRSYKIDYTLSSSAPNTAQGGSASIGFTWEAQNS
jgi:hypothetical protein